MKQESEAAMWMKRVLLVAAMVCAAGAGDAPSQAELQTRVDRVLKEMTSESVGERTLGNKHCGELPAEAYPLMEKSAEALKDSTQQSRIEMSVEELQGRYGARKYREQKAKDRAWMAQNAVACYVAMAKSGDWDKAAKTALELMLDPPAKLTAAELRQQRTDALAKAIATGCRDPLVRYYHRLEVVEDVTGDEQLRRFRAVYQETMDSKYPAIWKLVVTRGYMHYLWDRVQIGQETVDMRKEYAEILGATLPLWKEAVTQKEVPDDLLYDIMDDLVDASFRWAWQTTDLAEFFSRYFDPWVAARPEDSAAYALKCRVYLFYADNMSLEAGRQGKVDVFGPKDRGGRLAVARASGERAWESNPLDPHAATEMISMTVADDDSRQEMEHWYRRASALDPDSAQPVKRKAWWLHCQGLYADEMQFARECVESAEPGSEKVFALLQIHRDRAQWVTDQYFQRPAVWKDVQLTYEKALKFEPDNRTWRSWYAFYAFKAKDWKVAKKQFDAMGDKPDLTVFGTMTIYQYDQRKASRMLEDVGK